MKVIFQKKRTIKRKHNFMLDFVLDFESKNQFLAQNEHLKGFEFVDAVLDFFDFDYTVSSSDLQNIPTTGKVVIIANHPLGGLDALCLLRLISQVRQDIKIIANEKHICYILNVHLL